MWSDDGAQAKRPTVLETMTRSRNRRRRIPARAPVRPLAAPALVAVLVFLTAARSADKQTTLVYPPFGHCLGIHKVTDFHRFIYLGTRTKLDDPTGIAAVKLRSKDDPSTESDDDELTVFGLNSGRCEIIFNTSIYEASLYGTCGSGTGQFRDPQGIAADEAGDVFVTDTGNDRVVRLLYAKDTLRWIKAFGSEGAGELQFDEPTGLALGPSGTLYICDTGNNRVVEMTSTGEPVRIITGDASRGVTLDAPRGIAVVEADDPWISRGRNFMVVSDRGGTRLLKFSREGEVEAELSASALPVKDARFESLALDFYGNVYATDRTGGRIHKLDHDLQYVTTFGQAGEGDGEFDEPRGITLWKRFGQIFVTERNGAQYLWIGTDIQDLEAGAGGESAPVMIRYFLTETSRVTVDVLDERGRTLRRLVNDRRRAIGPNTERWDRRLDDGGATAPPGTYVVRVEATPTYSSGKYFHDTAETEVVLPRTGGSPADRAPRAP